MQSWVGITRYLHTVCLAHITLTHHALTAVGAQAKTANQDISLPGITQRLADFREASKRHRIEKLRRRSKVPPRFKKRLQELLMTP